MGINAPEAILVAYPNPFTTGVTMKYKLAAKGSVLIQIADINGRVVATINEGNRTAGDYTLQWNGARLAAGTYYAKITVNDRAFKSVKLVKVK